MPPPVFKRDGNASNMGFSSIVSKTLIKQLFPTPVSPNIESFTLGVGSSMMYESKDDDDLLISFNAKLRRFCYYLFRLMEWRYQRVTINSRST